MAGVIKVDRVQSDSNLAFNIAGANVAFMDASALRLVGSGITANGSTIVSGGRIVAAAQPVGTILQVVSTTKTDTWTNATGAWADVTGLSVTITPTSATSKILVMATLSATCTNGYNINAKLLRNSTDIAIGDAGAGSSVRTTASMYIYSGSTSYVYESVLPMNHMDSPATISPITYKVQAYGYTTTIHANRGFTDDGNAYSHRPISSITVMEIAQ